MQPSRLRTIGLGCLGLLLASGFGLWAARDLPRRAVAAVLSERLAARVRVDRLEILGADRFLLAGLQVAKFRDLPSIDALRVDVLEVEGSLSGILDNRFDRLRLRGAVARLAPAPPVESPDRPLPRIGELILEPASIRLAAGSGRDDLVLCLEAVVRDVGTPAMAFGAGEMRLSAATLDLAPLYALASRSPPEFEARVADLDAELAFGPGGDHLTASAALARGGGRFELEQPRIRADRFGPLTVLRIDGNRAAATLGGRLATLDQPSAEATVTATSDGVLRVELVPRLAGLSDGRLEIDWDPELGRARAVAARLHGFDLGGLVASLAPLPGGVALATLEGTVDAELRAAGDLLDYRLEIAVADLAIAGDLELSGLEGSTLRVTGSLPFAPLAELRAPVWDGPLKALIEIPAGHGRWRTLRLPPAALPLAARFTGRWLGDPGRAGGRLPRRQRFAGNYQLESGAGRLAADGEIEVRDHRASADLTWAWTDVELDSLVRLLRQTGLAIPAFELAGEGQARGRLRYPRGAGAPSVLGTLELQRLAAAGETGAGIFRWRAGASTASVRWSGGQAPIELLAMATSGKLTAPGIAPLDLDLQASGRFASDLGQGQLAGTLQETPANEAAGLGSAHITGGWRRRTDSTAEVSARLSLEGADLARWQGVAEPLAAAAALAGYRLAGVAGTDLEATLADGGWHLAGPAWLESAGFTSLDGSQVTEGLDSRFDLDLRGAAGSPIAAQARGRAGGFLLLWNTFFGDFSDVEATLTARARIEPAGDGPRRWRLEIESALPDGPIVEATLAERGDGWRYALSLDVGDLAATHQRYLAPLLKEQLGQLELGGKLAARVRGDAARLRGTAAASAWSVIGDLQIRDLRVMSGGGQAAVAGLDLDLPLDLRRSPGTELALSGPRLKGRLAFERLAVRGLELPPTESDLAVEADSVGLEKPIGLAVLGGAVALERLTLRQLLRPSRHLESGIELSGIRLEKISEELELFPLEGELNGRLAGVRLSPTLLAVDGGGEIEVFGGTVEVRDISGQDVLSRFPKLQLSADFQGLDLGALTRRIDFGEMTGILQGTLEDLELFRGVPVRFSARLETVHQPGMPRTVDVKAVNNITILGTGQRAGVLDRGIQKFFNRYTYQRLGVSMRLDRDVLLLHGLEHRDGKELFLRGRLPFRIDVVNAQPGKTVSFQTMVGRLKSLDFGHATTKPRKP